MYFVFNTYIIIFDLYDTFYVKKPFTYTIEHSSFYCTADLSCLTGLDLTKIQNKQSNWIKTK